MFLRARYLQVTDGRFITRDTWPGDERWPITFNPWPYANNNPVKFSDPTGHDVGCPGDDAGRCGAGTRNLLETILSWFTEPSVYADPEGRKLWAASAEMQPPGPGDFLVVLLFGKLEGGAKPPRASLGVVIENAAASEAAAVDAAAARALESRICTTTEVDLFAWGNKSRPRPPRLVKDITPDAEGMVGPAQGTFPKGASTYADPNKAPLKDHYHKLPAGTQLPRRTGSGSRWTGCDARKSAWRNSSHYSPNCQNDVRRIRRAVQ